MINFGFGIGKAARRHQSRIFARVHSSHPRNPLIADVCFKGGYIDSWGRGTLKIINACREAELPEPSITEQVGGFLVEIFKNRYTPEQLKKLGLNERQIKAVLYVAENGKITNSQYQKLFDVSRITATRDLKDLVEKGVLSFIRHKRRRLRITDWRLHHNCINNCIKLHHCASESRIQIINIESCASSENAVKIFFEFVPSFAVCFRVIRQFAEFVVRFRRAEFFVNLRFDFF